MIITYPIHLPYVAGSEHRVVPDTLYNNSEILSGSYPMGKNRFWHGGVHLHPTDRNAPIRAIADGEIVAYRFDDVDAQDEYFDKTSYSRSFVLLKHETELGQTSLGNSRLVFYSLYMHLRAWSKVKDKTGEQAINFLKKTVPPQPKIRNGHPLKDTQGKPIMEREREERLVPTADGTVRPGAGHSRVQRGDVLGYCGHIPDNLTTPSQGIHFEIILDDVNFLQNPVQAIWGKCFLTASLPVLNELLSKKELAVEQNKPLTVVNGKIDRGYLRIKVDEENKLWIAQDQFDEENNSVPHPRQWGKTQVQKQFIPVDKRVFGYVHHPVDNAQVLDTGTAIIPWMAPWLNTGEFQERSHEGKVWIQIYRPDKNQIVWAEKGTANYVSDADWKNFRKQEEHGHYSKDGFIDDEGLQRLVEDSQRQREAKSGVPLDKDHLLRHLVTRHPTEWSQRDIAQRYARVTQEEFGPQKLTVEQFQKLTKHIERLAFWESVPGLPDAKGVWHVHPIKFIEHLAKCMWLSKNELARIYPTAPSGNAATISNGTSEELREKYRVEINKCCVKYALNNRLRMAHFFAQGAVECKSLNEMVEATTGMKYEGNSDIGNIAKGDGPTFKGRGFKQLTGRYNYSEYWAFRGWLTKGIDFQIGWETEEGREDHKRPPVITNPDRIVEAAFECIDTATWYCVRLRPKTISAMDRDDVRAVTHAVNGGKDTAEWEESSSLVKRIHFTSYFKKVML